MTIIESYVVIDVETSGLQGSHFGRTKITEICLIGVIRKDFKGKNVPRSINKLTMCFHPEKWVSDKSERNSGLSNDILEKQLPFDRNFCDILHNFILRLPKPICFLAHNGIQHDFPLLLATMKSLGKPLPDDILCFDTLVGFRGIKPPDKRSKSSEDEITELSSNDEIIPAENGTKTPKSKKYTECPAVRSKRDCSSQSDIPTPQVNSVMRNLNEQFGIEKPYSLSSIYYDLFKHEIPNAHTAEGDAVALLKCIAAYGTPIHMWISKYSIKLNKVPKCW